MTKVLGKFRGPTGVWRYQILRDNTVYWGSLHTRDERRAEEKLNRMKIWQEEAERDAKNLGRRR